MLAAAALFMGVFKVSETGMQWFEDGARYLNNAAMVRDYLLSDQWLHPYQFALGNYRELPCFSIPYHPPGYALMMAVWFLGAGMSFESGRVFIALFLGGIGVVFFAILRQQKIPAFFAFVCALLLISSPELVRWGRSTMSEIPAFFFILAGNYFFLKWIETKKVCLCAMAFLLALIAFFCRVTSAGMLPLWGVYFVYRKKMDFQMLKVMGLCSFIYLLFGISWTKFSAGFAQNEIRTGIELYERVGRIFDGNLWMTWGKSIPEMTGPIIAVLAIVSLLYLIRFRKVDGLLFWGGGTLIYFLFNLMLTSHYESRYFIFGLPGLFGLIACVFGFSPANRFIKPMVLCLLTIAMVFNIVHFVRIPPGVVGHKEISEALSRLEKPGNILVSCWHDADLMFRYRSLMPQIKRQLIRGDRTVAIRPPSYAEKSTVLLAGTRAEIMDIIGKGRIRYILTATPMSNDPENHPIDMKILHATVSADETKFRLKEKFKIRRMFSDTREADIYLWEYQGDLPDGPSELDIVIPTANLVIKSEQ